MLNKETLQRIADLSTRLTQYSSVALAALDDAEIANEEIIKGLHELCSLVGQDPDTPEVPDTSQPEPKPETPDPSKVESDEGTSLTAPGSYIVDRDLAVWELRNGPGEGLCIYRDGTYIDPTNSVEEMIYHGGYVFQKNKWNDWYQWDYADWIGATDPRKPAPEPELPDPVVIDPVDPNDPLWEQVKRPTLIVPKEVYAPPGQQIIYIPLEADRELDMTVHVEAGVRNSNGWKGRINVGSKKSQFTPKPHPTWRPGDDRLNYLEIHMVEGPRDAGDGIDVIVTPSGFRNLGGKIVKIIYQEGAVNKKTETFHRKPMRLDLTGKKPAVSFDPKTAMWSPKGKLEDGTPCWESKLPHGRTQGANNEAGAYLDDSIPGSVDPIRRGSDSDGDFVRLHSCRLPETVVVEGRNYDHQAVMINGRTMPEWRMITGVYSAKLAMPDRDGAWPAFWTIGCNSKGHHNWPPENDIVEHFVYGTDWKVGRHTSYGQHAGPRNSNSRKSESSHRTNFDTTGIHEYATLMLEDWIYWFIDGEEIGCQRTMIHDGGLHFPLLNVAVHGSAQNKAYDTKDGDMRIYAVERYDVGAEVLSK